MQFFHDVRCPHKLMAVCKYRTYDVWGNAKDGYEVNDSYSHGEIRIPGEVSISNVPKLPTDKDNSFTVPMMIAFVITDKQIKKSLGITCPIDIEGDDTTYYINRRRDNKPLCELSIMGWEEAT